MDRMPPQGAIPETNDALMRAMGAPAPVEGQVCAGEVAAAERTHEPSREERVARLVNAIEQDIIPRLVSAHRSESAGALSEASQGLVSTDAIRSSHMRLVHDDDGRATGAEARTTPSGESAVSTEPAVPPERIAAFIDALLRDDETALRSQLTACLEITKVVEPLYSQVLAPAARRLGELWVQDRCHFADVTIGVGRLHQLMRELSPAFVGGIVPQSGARRILLTPAPGEQHSLGVAMVADYFARDGWDVVVVPPQPTPRAASAHIVKFVQNEWFDVIGVSVGSARALGAVSDLVRSCRRASRNRAVGILLGGSQVHRHADLMAAVGADGVATDAAGASAAADALLASRLSRADLATAAESFSRQA